MSRQPTEGDVNEYPSDKEDWDPLTNTVHTKAIIERLKKELGKKEKED